MNISKGIIIIILVFGFAVTLIYVDITDFEFPSFHFLNPNRNKNSQINLIQMFDYESQLKLNIESSQMDFCNSSEIRNVKLNDCLDTIEFKLNLTNPPWQELKSSDGSIGAYLYGAYLDTRLPDKTRVHVLTMVKGSLDLAINKIQCHFWYDSDPEDDIDLISVPQLIEMKVIFNVKASFVPTLIICEAPKQYFEQIPVAVTVSFKESTTKTTKNQKNTGGEICGLKMNSMNFLKVVYNLPCGNETQKDFGICHKALYFKGVDASELLIEWLEIHRILGVNKVFMYDYFPHPNMSKVLKYYQDAGFVETKHHPIPFLSPQTSPDAIFQYLMKHQMDKWVNELIPYHDCFLRNLYKFKYMALIDLDEVIMPIEHRSWKDLIVHAEEGMYKKDKNPIGGFSFDNNIFPDNGVPPATPDAPKNFYMLQHLTRMESKKAGANRKLLYSTAVGLGLHNHVPKFCIEGGCRVVNVSPNLGRVHHYCLDGAKTCADKDYRPFTDLNMWRFKDQLVNASNKAKQSIHWGH